jgi:uncharacterized Fe-S cluster protein YjdI
MKAKEIIKRYDKDGITIVWKPAKCIHSEICVRSLPRVYRPEEKPWIQPENATVEELQAQITRCPSGALSYENESTGNDKQMSTNEIKVIKGGPLMVKGSIQLEGADGDIQSLEGSNALCRCGASGRKPYCDGSHRKISFE